MTSESLAHADKVIEYTHPRVEASMSASVPEAADFGRCSKWAAF
jgi:hypothetical protein